MFDKEYTFRGSHAEKVIKLTAKFDEKNQIFNRNYDVYLMAPIVGFLYQREAEPNNGGDRTTKIFPDILMKNSDDLAFNYRMIMLLDKKNAANIDERVDKAFRLYNSDKAYEDEKLYDQYVLGGVDVLYEKIIGTSTTSEEYLNNLYDFMEEMDDRYNQLIDPDRIAELCKLAKK